MNIQRAEIEMPSSISTSPELNQSSCCAAVEHQLQRADADRQERKTEKIEAADALDGVGHEGEDAEDRRVNVAGTAAQLTRAFGTTLRRVSSPDPAGSGRVEHRYREGRLLVPAGLEGIVLAVLGLDDRPQASPHFRVSVEAATPSSYTPPQVARAYRFPEGTDGTGQTIAILEFGGGFSASDLQSYFSGLGLTVPSITAARVNGASNAPG